MRQFRWSSDEGRVAIGPFIALLVVAGAAYGAYWMLGEYGFLGTEAEEVEHEELVEEVDERPEWLHGTDYELPSLVQPDEGDLGPPYREPPPWLWELVDASWTPHVISVGDGDQYTWFSDYQGLYLTSPTDELFKITELETTSAAEVIHWDPELTLAWLVQVDRFDKDQVVQYNLSTRSAKTDFGGHIFSSANVVGGGVANLEYYFDMADGRELWVTHSPQGYVTGVVWRDGEHWNGSLLTDEIRRLAQQALGTDGGVDGWFDPDGERAVYHAVYLDPDTKTLAEEVWIVHDFNGDVIDRTAVVAVPRDGCIPAAGPRSGAFEGDRIVANCGGTEYLLDPYHLGEPIQR